MSKRTRFALHILTIIAKWITDDAELRKEIESIASGIKYNADLVPQEVL